MQNKLLLNHLGFLPESKKEVLTGSDEYSHFQVQAMNISAAEGFGTYENWKTIYEGEFQTKNDEFGKNCVGDFSEITTPGLYRVTVENGKIGSYQFMIADNIYSKLPYLFLDFMHSWRSGKHENEWRGPANLDDAVRSDNGEQIDVTGGWYDAGDLRKWMVHTNLPILGFLDQVEALGVTRNHFSGEGRADNDFITESFWAIDFICKMQDADTGMFFEDVGGGGNARKQPGMSWWYENHSGCLADNSDNRFTDNIPGSGDERKVRVNYNPIVQYTSCYILLRAMKYLKKYQPEVAELAEKVLDANRGYMTAKGADEYDGWTTVKSWKLLYDIERYKVGQCDLRKLKSDYDSLMENHNPDTGFWFNDATKRDSFRAILHSVQPLIALCRLHEVIAEADNVWDGDIKATLKVCLDKYAIPMSETNPFGFIPFGLFFNPSTPDHYRKHPVLGSYRFAMPDRSPQAINHGLGGHWTSWSHALALMSKVIDSEKAEELAWKQIQWLTGNNQFDACLISGVGYNNPMPHSRYFGTHIGGFMIGFTGDEYDNVALDQDKRAQWSNTEYWVTCKANMMMALAVLLKDKPRNRKLG